jgi:hypothetical protein
MLALGEVHTGLLQNSVAVSSRAALDLLTLLVDERVRTSERPIAHAVSPDLLTGVDCQLATRSGTTARGVGTVGSRAAVTGGHVLQGSAFSRLTRSKSTRRLPWSYYLTQPGAVEVIGKATADDLVQGFLSADAGSGVDLATVSARVMRSVGGSARLDRRPPFRMERIQLRWAAVEPAVGDAEQVAFRIHSPTLRTVRITAKNVDFAAVIDLCEDLALHDWLLTALLLLIDRARAASGIRGSRARTLRPAVDHLLHLWMPGARVDPALLPVWEGIERRPGFSRQWETSVERVRDQVAATTMALLEVAAEERRRSE